MKKSENFCLDSCPTVLEKRRCAEQLIHLRRNYENIAYSLSQLHRIERVCSATATACPTAAATAERTAGCGCIRSARGPGTATAWRTSATRCTDAWGARSTTTCRYATRGAGNVSDRSGGSSCSGRNYYGDIDSSSNRGTHSRSERLE